MHRCQHGRTKKRDSANEKASNAGVTKKIHRQVAPLVLYSSTSSRRYMDFARATITRDIFIPATHIFYNFAERISFAEHLTLVAESTELHLTLSRAHFFHLVIRKKTGQFK